MKRRGFLGLLAAAVGVRLKPDTTYGTDLSQVVTRVHVEGLDLASGADYSVLITCGCLTPNEVRAREDVVPMRLWGEPV